MFLRFNIDAGHVESGAVVSHGGASGAAEKVK